MTERIRSTSPQEPTDVVAEVVSVDRPGVLDAATQASKAQGVWRRTPPTERAAQLTAVAEALAARADEVAGLVVREVGKPILEARGEVARAVAIFRYYAQVAFDPNGDSFEPSSHGFARTERRPKGVAGLITPWNFPIAIPAWKAAPALAYGNTVLLKPAPAATACAQLLGELVSEAMTGALLTVLPGDAETGAAIIESSNCVSFTGSSAVGRAVIKQAAEYGKTVQAEMGGLNAAIVLPDADIEEAAKIVASAAMGYAGQKCTATSRVVVVGDPGDFIDAVVAAVEELSIGDPSDPATVIGPVINAAARDKVLAASSTGGAILTGGSSPARDGWFVSPTIVRDPSPGSVLDVQEVFGPIASVTAVDSLEQALQLANSGGYGLVTSVFTGSLNNALEAIDGLESGMIRVNQASTGVDFWMPFGGEKSSSYGPKEQGRAAREFYTSIRSVSVGSAL